MDKDLFEWIPCAVRLPESIEEEILCLVTCKEWNIFTGNWGRKEVRILSYSTILHDWNIKSNIKVEAWVYLPEPF